jgi:hypothetical protein
MAASVGAAELPFSDGRHDANDSDHSLVLCCFAREFDASRGQTELFGDVRFEPKQTLVSAGGTSALAQKQTLIDFAIR